MYIPEILFLENNMQISRMKLVDFEKSGKKSLVVLLVVRPLPPCWGPKGKIGYPNFAGKGHSESIFPTNMKTVCENLSSIYRMAN